MPDTPASRQLAQSLASIDARLTALEAAARTPQLQNASITGAALTIYDDDGETVLQTIGKQADGSPGVVAVNGPTPPVPSAATVEAASLGLSVSWDGAFADDIPQPADFDHAAVHLSTTDGYTPDATTLRGTLSRAGSISLTPLTTEVHYVRLVAVSTSGAQSDPSEQTAGTPLPAADIGPGSITETEIADDSISTPKLRAEAVTADKIAANTITAGQIAAGAITAETIDADALNGKTITGAVVQTAASGQRVVLDGVGNRLAFYSGTAEEVTPGALFAAANLDGATFGYVELHAPDLGAGNMVSIELLTRPDGNDRLDITAPTIFLNAEETTVSTDEASGPVMFASEWTTLPLASGVVANASFGYAPEYRMISATTVELRGVLARSSGSFASGVSVATLPAEIRPAEQVNSLGAANAVSSKGYMVRLEVNPAGDLIPRYTALTYAAGELTWLSIDGFIYDLS